MAQQDEPPREAPSARKRSIIWGLPDAFTMRAGIERNDTGDGATRGGMNWQLADGAGVCGRTYRGASNRCCVIPRWMDEVKTLPTIYHNVKS